MVFQPLNTSQTSYKFNTMQQEKDQPNKDKYIRISIEILGEFINKTLLWNKYFFSWRKNLKIQYRYLLSVAQSKKAPMFGFE